MTGHWDEVFDLDPEGYQLDPGRVEKLLGFAPRHRQHTYRQPVIRDEEDGYQPDDYYEPPNGWEP